ncbi:MAG: LamG domain-containing protein [Patulibacter minatonensis]
MNRPTRLAAVLLAAVLLAISALASAAQAAPPLVGQWHLDAKRTEAGQDVVDDSSGSGANLFGAMNGVLLDANLTKFGGALTTGSSTVLKSAVPGPAPANVTLMAWVKQNGDPGTLRYIAGRGEDGPGQCLGSSYALYTGYAAKPGLRFYVRHAPHPDSVLTEAPATAKVFDNQWHLVTGTYDGTTARLFVDGDLISAVSAGGPKPINYDLPSDGTPSAGGKMFYVDGYPQPTCGNGDFPGRIDEVRVYDRALSQTEIGRLAASTGPNPPELQPDPAPAPGATPTPEPTPIATPVPPVETPTPPARSTAVFAAPPAGSTIGGAVTLDASASANVDRFKWDFGGDGRTDATCPGSQPVVSVSTSTAASKPVSLSTFAPGATEPVKISSSTFIRPTIALGGVRKSAQTLTKLPGSLLRVVPPDVVTCAAKTLTGAGTFLGPGGAASITQLCMPQTVIWGLASASGCFKRLEDESGIPAAERAVIRSHYESEKFPPTVVVLCNRAAKGEIPQDTCDKARAMLTVKFDVYVATSTVDLNGLKITPQAGKAVVIFPKLNRLVTSGATMKWGAMTVRSGAIDFNFVNDSTANRIRFTGQGSRDCACGRSAALVRYSQKDLPEIAGFKVTGSIDLALEGVDGERTSSGVLNLTLPADFGVFGKNPPSATVKVYATNGTAPKFDDLLVKVPEANLGPLRMTDVQFRYAARGRINGDWDPNSTCDRNEWRAQANVFIAGGKGGETGIRLSPPPSQNGVGFCDGGFRHAGGAVTFGGPIPKPVLFPGVTLDEINFALQLHPFLARGGVGISVGEIARVRGALLMALATPQEPYTLTPFDAGSEFRTLAGRRFTSTTIMGGGDVSLKFPGVGFIPVGAAAAMWSYPDHVAARGEVRIVVPGFAVYGYAAVEALMNDGLFTSSIGGKACLAGVKKGLCLGGDANVTSKGIVACLNILDTFHPGAGLNWASRKVEIWPIDGCKPSHYWVTFPARGGSARAVAARLAAGDRRTFQVAAGEDAKNVRIIGKGTPPKVKLTAPDGESITVDGDDFVSSAHMLGVRYDGDDQKAVYLGVKNGQPGTYTVEALDGSTELGEMSVTKDGYDSAVTASVGAPARGARSASAARAAAAAEGEPRTLRYDAGRKGGGQQVTFSERTEDGTVLQEIQTVGGGKGTLTFTPVAGDAGKRQIVAAVSIDGIPAAPQVVSTYSVGTPQKLPAPRGVKVRRAGKGLVVSWTPVAGADRYGVLLQFAGTKVQRQLTAGGGARRLTIKDVPLSESGTVRVTAHGGVLRAYGRSATSPRFAATKALPTSLQTGSRNEKKGNF